MGYAKRNKKQQDSRGKGGTLCAVLRRCGGCGKKQRFRCAGKFRVNANGRRLDVWLIYRCEKCGHTLNIPLYQRVPPERIPPDLYRGFLENDPALAARFAASRGLFKGLGYELE